MAKKLIKSDKVSETSTKVMPILNDAQVAGPTPQMREQQDFLANIAKPFFQSSSDSRRKYDQEWLGRNLFWRGYQFSRYLPETQTVVLAVRQSARIPVNLTTAYMRSIRNQVTAFRPKFEVLPTVPNNDSSQTQARYAQRLLDYYFDHLKLKMKIKETIVQALMYSIGGPWQIVYDPLTKEIKIWLLDPFDYYMDPLAEDPNEGEGEVKAARAPIAAVTSNQQYSLEARREVKGGSEILAASPQKQFLLQTTRIISPKMSTSSPFVILYEGSFRRYHEDGTKYTVHCIWTEQNTIPLLYEELETDESDYVVYRGDLVPKEPYGESWIKHVMVINRAINTLESSALEYNSRIAKGRLVVDRDAGVKAIHNVHGEIISKNRGSQIQSLDMAPLANSVPEQIERMLKYAMDISGVHEASLGSVPTGMRSGIGVAELKQSDSSSQDDLVDNLEDFLTEVAMKILKKIAQNYTSYKVIKDLGVREGDEKYFAVIGKEAAKGKTRAGDKLGRPGQVKIGPDWFDVAEIGDDNNIRVTIGSWLGYTKEALQQKVQAYFQIGLIDQGTALKLLEFGDIDSVIQKTRLETILKRPPQQNPNGQPQVDQYDLALSENDMVLEGKVPTPRDAYSLVTSDQDHMVHIAVHQDALGKGFDDILGALIEAHQIQLESGVKMNAGMPMQPQTPPQPGGQPGMMPQMPPQGGMPGQAPQEAAPGPPPGQQLPQQNLPAVQAANTNQAASMMTPQTPANI